MHAVLLKSKDIAGIAGNTGKCAIGTDSHVIGIGSQTVKYIPVEAVAELTAADMVAIHAP